MPGSVREGRVPLVLGEKYPLRWRCCQRAGYDKMTYDQQLFYCILIGLGAVIVPPLVFLIVLWLVLGGCEEESQEKDDRYE